MGSFDAPSTAKIHDIYLTDSVGKLYARIVVLAEYSYRESWAHLKDTDLMPAPPTDADSRQIIKTLIGITVSAYGKDSESKAGADVQQVVDEMNANNGLIIEPGVNQEIINFEDKHFEQIFRKRMKSNNYEIRFWK